MKFKPTPEEPIYSSEPLYDLIEGGYINPEAILESPQDIANVQYAIATVRSFLEDAEGAGHLEIT